MLQAADNQLAQHKNAGESNFPWLHSGGISMPDLTQTKSQTHMHLQCKSKVRAGKPSNEIFRSKTMIGSAVDPSGPLQ